MKKKDYTKKMALAELTKIGMASPYITKFASQKALLEVTSSFETKVKPKGGDLNHDVKYDDYFFDTDKVKAYGSVENLAKALLDASL